MESMAWLTFVLFCSLSLAGDLSFREHVLDSNLPGGYAVHVADLNRDGRPDVIGLSTRASTLNWYENPAWTSHPLVENMPGLVNLSPHDTDGDGIPEIALGTAFSMVAAKSEGLVWLLRNPGDPRKLWKPERVDALTTSHHFVWADLDGDGRKELVNAPLIGPKALAPKYEDHVPLVFYFYRPGNWQRSMIDEKLFGVLHRVRAVRWRAGAKEQLLTAGFDGIVLHEAEGKGPGLRWKNTLLGKGHQEEAPRSGSSDVAMGRLQNRRFLAAIEPWHGNEVVVYLPGSSGDWTRQVIFDGLKEGHEVALADFDGDGRDDIVAGDRGKDGASVHLFSAEDKAGAKWRHQIIDRGGMAGSGCTTADLNADNKPDVVCIGASTGNLKWYENLK
jgi:hypothetical protein